MKNRINRLKKQYRNQPVPPELDRVAEQALRRGGASVRRRKWIGRGIGAVAAALLLFTAGLNALPALAVSMQDLPVLGPIVEVLTFARFSADGGEHGYQVNVDVPRVQGIGSGELEDSLNSAYLEQGRELYESFLQEIGNPGEGEVVHKALDAGYEVKVQSDSLLTIGRYVVRIAASGAESVQYDTIDLENGLLLTLPGLFKDDGYIGAISDYITQEMRRQMEAGKDKVYFIGEEKQGFTKIAPDQTFYINGERQLVIVFDEYEVAPGMMGVVEFTIPIDVIESQLAGHGYIR